MCSLGHRKSNNVGCCKLLHASKGDSWTNEKIGHWAFCSGGGECGLRLRTRLQRIVQADTMYHPQSRAHSLQTLLVQFHFAILIQFIVSSMLPWTESATLQIKDTGKFCAHAPGSGQRSPGTWHRRRSTTGTWLRHSSGRIGCNRCNHAGCQLWWFVTGTRGAWAALRASQQHLLQINGLLPLQLFQSLHPQ